MSNVRKPWTEEQKQFLRSHYQEMKTSELTALFNRTYNETRNVNQITKCLNAQGIKCSKKRHRFTVEQKNYLLANQDKYSSISDLVSDFNIQFNLDCDYAQINHQLHRMGVRRQPNITSAHEARSHELGFSRPGSRGEQLIKTEEGWKRDYVVIWEEANGPVPGGYCIIHLDHNISNNDLSNLACIPRRYLGTLSGLKWMSTNPDITKSGVLWCQLQEEILNNR